MLYLITEEQRNRIISNYYGRVLHVAVWFLVGIFVIVGILSLPTILLLQTEVKTSEGKIVELEQEVATAKLESTEEDATSITNKLELLKAKYPVNIREKYTEVEKIVENLSGVKITSLSIDALAKKVQIITVVNDKEAAKSLVDAFNNSPYKGASLPYSVLSEKSSFTFAQNLSYE